MQQRELGSGASVGLDFIAPLKIRTEIKTQNSYGRTPFGAYFQPVKRHGLIRIRAQPSAKSDVRLTANADDFHVTR